MAIQSIFLQDWRRNLDLGSRKGMKALRFLTVLLASLLVSLATCQKRVIAVGDLLRVSCPDEPALCGTFEILSSGLAVLPIVSGVELAGRTEQEAERDLERALIERGRRLQVSVRVAGTTIRAIRFSGAVEVAGEIPWSQGMTLKDLLLLAKPTETADIHAIKIVPGTGDAKLVDFTRFNPQLLPGDIVIVPLTEQPEEVYLLGAVQNPGSVPFVEGMNAWHAIVGAGGLTRQARLERAKIIKQSGEEWPLDLAPGAPMLPLHPGDRIILPTTDNPRFVHVIGAVQRPGAIDYAPNLTLERAISEAGGLLPNADPKRITKRSTLPGASDATIHPFDVIEVPFVGEERPKNQNLALRIIGIILGIGR